MRDKNSEVPGLESPCTVTDDQIVTERKVGRRSFLGATGAVVAGAAAIVSGVRAATLQDSSQNDPDKPRPADPDKPRAAEPDRPKPSDPDKPRTDDAPKSGDAPKPDDTPKRPSDPDKPPPSDPQRARR